LNSDFLVVRHSLQGVSFSSSFLLWIFQKFGKEVVFCFVDFLLQVWFILFNECEAPCVFVCYVPV
jgi:hypothetical protein